MTSGRNTWKTPALQNIPIRTEIGKQIREAFCPKDRLVFLDMDFAQIEQRIYAQYR